MKTPMLQQKDVLPVFSIILDVKKCKSQENYLKLLIPLNLKKKIWNMDQTTPSSFMFQRYGSNLKSLKFFKFVFEIYPEQKSRSD